MASLATRIIRVLVGGHFQDGINFFLTKLIPPDFIEEGVQVSHP